MGLDIIHSSDCLFTCAELQESTTKLRTALAWVLRGREVGFSYKGDFVGNLSYYGEFDELSDAVEAVTEYGSVVYIRSEHAYHINIPD